MVFSYIPYKKNCVYDVQISVKSDTHEIIKIPGNQLFREVNFSGKSIFTKDIHDVQKSMIHILYCVKTDATNDERENVGRTDDGE